MLNKVSAQNFISWKKLEFNLTSGVTLIDGWNEDDQTSEGSGKSSILNAISWCLFGKLPKDLNVDDVIKYGEESCKVQLDFSDGISVVRTRKPNDLYIVNRGKTMKGKDSRETQVMIQEYLGLSFESFCQSSYFPQNYAKKFLLSNQEEKGKILSDIQDISIFDKARKEAHELAKLEYSKMNSLVNQIQIEQSNLNGTVAQKNLVQSFIVKRMEQFESQLRDMIVRKQSTENSIQNDYAQAEQIAEMANLIDPVYHNTVIETAELTKNQLNQEYADVSYKKGNLDNIKKSISQKEVEGKRYATKYQTLETKKSQLELFIQNPVKNCPTCGSEMKGTDTSHIQKELESIELEMTEVLQTLETISQFLDSTVIESDTELTLKSHEIHKSIQDQDKSILVARKKIHERESLDKNVYFILERIKKSEEVLKVDTDAISKMSAPDLSTDETKLQMLTKSETNIQEKISHLVQHELESRSHYERLEVLKEGFKEIKSYVFNTALNELSFRANEFLTQLFEVPATITFQNDDLKIETQISLSDQVASVGQLSGGQFRRFSLAVDLALSDMTSSRKTSKLNMLVLDEYFKDVSETTMEKCLELLKLRKSPVLLIEHNSIFKNIVDNVFFVRLEKGTSYESRR